MLHEELIQIAEPLLGAVREHPFWTGLADGSLPPAALARFVAQDTDHLLPVYARALARCAASAPSNAHAALLSRSAFASLEARDRLRLAYGELTPALRLVALPEIAAAEPATRAHCATFTAASATSFVVGVGALLPMVWFNHRVSDQLLERHAPGSRYEPWIQAYHPGPGYTHAVRAFLAMVDAVAEEAGPRGRDQIVESFVAAAEHEPAFADTAWQARADSSIPDQERTFV